MDGLRNEAIRQYGLSPSVTLSVVNSGGSLGSLIDTRLQAGTGDIDASAFASEASLQDVSVIQVSYARIDDTTPGTAAYAREGFSWPLYRVSGGLQAMSLTDVYDTFVDPVLNTLSGGDAGTNTAGTYTVSASTSVSGATLVSSTPIFTDTRSNADNYTADGLLETRDQPETITNYYLHRWNPASAGSFSKYVCHGLSSTDATAMSEANIQSQLGSLIKYYMQEEVSYNLSSGTARGSAISNTARTGGKYITFQVDENDYRAQIVPDYDATATAINTYRLYISRS